jgi:hypothetical protein
MSDRIQIQITATDGASRVFGQVASGADKMTASVSKSNASFDAIEANTRQTVAELQKLNQTMAQSSAATEKAAASASSFSKVGAAIGASLGVAVVAFGEFGRAAAESEAAQARVETAVESTGAAFDEYAAQIQAASDTALELSFDDEDALNAISAITTATGDAAFAIENLGLVMDIARGRQIDLAAASKIVIAAEQGRYGSLARLGIQLDENATKEEALAALQTKYAGQAEAYAATSAGAYDRFTNAIENQMETLGAHAQSLTAVALVAQSLSPAFALASTAVGGFGKSIAAAVQAGGAVQSLGLIATAMTGPVGIVVAAGLAGVAISQFAGNIGPEFAQASDDAIASIDALIAKVVELGDTSALGQTVLGLDTISAEFQKINDDANQVIGRMGDWIARAQQMDDANAETVEGLMMSEASFDGLSQSVRDTIDANQDGTATLEELTNAQAFYNDEAERTKQVLDGLQAGADELSTIFAMTGEGAAFAKSEANAFTEALLRGEITAATYEDWLQQLITGYGNIQEESVAAGEGVATYTGNVEDGTTAMEQFNAAMAEAPFDAITISMQELGAASVDLGRALVASTDPFVIRQSEILAGMQAQMTAMGAMSAALGATPPDTTQSFAAADAAIENAIAGAEAHKSAQEGLAVGIENAADAMTYQVNETQRLADENEKTARQIEKAQAVMATSFEAVTTAVTGTTDALESGFRVAVSNTSAIADNSQAVADWALELGGAIEHFDEWGNSVGWWSRMDEVVTGWGSNLAAATLSVEDHGEALTAFNDIAQENAEIQQNIAVIQAQQAPIMADLMEQQENYLQSVAEMGPEQQMFALAMMDSATSARALELSMGLLSENGDVFAPMVEAAANLDPYLAAILERMGLIEQQPDGTWTVTLDDQASSPMQDLSASITDLADQVYILTTYLDDDATNDGIGRLEEQLADLDQFEAVPTVGLEDNATGPMDDINSRLTETGNRSVSPTVGLVDNASSGLGSIRSQLDGLYDKTIYVTTVHQSIRAGADLGLGGVAGYAVGGVVAEMAEWGPELLHFPNGGVALARDRGLYSVPQGTYVDTAPATAYKLGGGVGVTININGPASWDDAAEQVSRKIVPAIQRAMREHERSLGAWS